ncbi:MAG: exodeoxyribonuclease VII small subunit [Phycisphaeraceae bacterium]|nr:exodeoxyribonuclease VII small subunit [Phycisphaeraceae bacterium]
MSDSEPDETPIEEMPYEVAIERLESILEQVESGEIGLEQTLEVYERGVKLIKRCESILSEAETRIATLTETTDGELSAEASSDPPTDDDA